MGLLQDKVALITGAGGGLGRAYALLFAKEGAKVVVNDLGGARDGTGSDASLADRVVAEIVEAGGEAVANYGSVAERAPADAMVKQAIDTFGRLDIVINNAGILRDKTLLKMTDEQWDLVQAVHLRGTYLVTRAAVAHMVKAQTKGRIVNTSSYAGLKGNFGQANYGAAKAGIAGFTRVVALETRKFGITCNAIAPVAKTRMTEDIDMVPEAYEPEDIAPLVAWLASEEAGDVTGRVFGAHGSHYFEYLVETTEGVDLGEDRWEPAKVGARFEAITRKKKAAATADSGEANPQVEALFAGLPETFKADKGAGWTAKIVFDVGGTAYSLVIDAGEARFEEGAVSGKTATVTFDSADTLLAMASGKLAPEQAFMSGKVKTDNMGALMKFGQYFDLAQAAANAGATGSEGGSAAGKGGVNLDAAGKRYRGSAAFVTPEAIVAYAHAVDDENPRYLETGDDQIAPPLFPVRPLFGVLMEAIRDPELNADLLRLVHGEQDMRFYRHLKPWDLAAPRAEITTIEEKSSGWLINVRQWLMVEGEMTTEATSGIFVRKPAGEKGEKKDEKKQKAAPQAEPERDVIFEGTQTVAKDQPLRYAEASGDHNPIHVDEEVARAAGLPSVILHGLCTMAFAGRAVVDGICEGEPERLRRLACRFSAPVLPGWELTTRIWKQDETDGVVTYGLEVINQEGVKVLTHGLAEVAEG